MNRMDPVGVCFTGRNVTAPRRRDRAFATFRPCVELGERRARSSSFNHATYFRPARRATLGSRETSSGGSPSALASRRATILPTFSSTPPAGQVSPPTHLEPRQSPPKEDNDHTELIMIMHLFNYITLNIRLEIIIILHTTFRLETEKHNEGMG